MASVEVGDRVRVGLRAGVVRANGNDGFRGEWALILFDNETEPVELKEVVRTPLDMQLSIIERGTLGDESLGDQR